MTDLARDVAKELDRRRRRRRLLWLGAFATLVTLAVLYLRCGSGWGTGGSGDGTGSGARTAAADAGPHRCSIRVAASGISVEGIVVTREQAVSRCGKTSGADVLVTGDARQGDWDELRAALEVAHVPVFLRR